MKEKSYRKLYNYKGFGKWIKLLLSNGREENYVAHNREFGKFFRHGRKNCDTGYIGDCLISGYIT